MIYLELLAYLGLVFLWAYLDYKYIDRNVYPQHKESLWVYVATTFLIVFYTSDGFSDFLRTGLLYWAFFFGTFHYMLNLLRPNKSWNYFDDPDPIEKNNSTFNIWLRTTFEHVEDVVLLLRVGFICIAVVNYYADISGAIVRWIIGMDFLG